MIEIENLDFGYRKNRMVLQDVSLHLGKGLIHGLLGKNGVGKTTLLRLIAGLSFPDGGSVRIGRFTPTDRKVDFLSDMFFLPEEFPEIRLRIDRYVKINSVFYPSFSHEDFRTYLNEFEIDDIKQRMDKLSYGTRKKVLIAFGLACHCSLMLLDEPTNGLDIPSKTQFRRVMLKAVDENSCVVISTHQVRDLHNLIDSIVILDHNNILLNADSRTITDRLYFGLGDGSEQEGDVLYSEQGIEGQYVVRVNRNHQESNLDIELLFNAALTDRQRIRELFPQDKNTVI